MNRLERKAQKEQESQQKKVAARKEFESDIHKKAAVCRKFINDKRFADFRDLFYSLIHQKREERESLPFSVKTQEEYAFKALIIDLEISAIKKVFETPEKFFEMDKEIKGETE
jgi:hypothetical protein